MAQNQGELTIIRSGIAKLTGRAFAVFQVGWTTHNMKQSPRSEHSGRHQTPSERSRQDLAIVITVDVQIGRYSCRQWKICLAE